MLRAETSPPPPPPPPGSAPGAAQKPGSPRSLHAAMRTELHQRFKQALENHVPVWMQPHTGVDITPDEELAPWHRPSDVHTQEKMFQIMARVRGDRDSADHRSNLPLKPSTVKRALLAAEMNVELALNWLGTDHPTHLFLNHSDLAPIAGVTLIQRVTEVFQISRILPLSSPLPSISFSAGRRSFSMQGGSAGHPNRTCKCKESRGQQGGTGATRGDQAFPFKTCSSYAARRPGRCAPLRRAAGTRSHAHDHAGFRVQTAHSAARRDAQP